MKISRKPSHYIYHMFIVMNPTFFDKYSAMCGLNHDL